MESAVAIDQVIQKNLSQLQKPGVLVIRPGYKSKHGMVTDVPSIVVTVEDKRAKVPKRDLVPPIVGGYPTDVRQASPMHELRASDPDLYAEVAATAPPELQRPIFPFERDAAGQLIAPALAVAAAKLAARKPPKEKIPYSAPVDLPLDPVSDEFTITCHASPDAGWPTLQPFLTDTKHRLTVAMYEFTAPYIVQSFIASLKGKHLAMVLDDPSDPTKRDQTDDTTHAQLVTGLAKSMTFAWALEAHDPHASTAIFPSAYHIKVIVRDGTAFWLSSGNLNRTNQPLIDPVKNPAAAKLIVPSCDRDWHVIVEHAGLSSLMESYIKNDFAVASQHQQAGTDAKTVSAALNSKVTTPKGKGKVPVKYFSPKSITANMMIEPVLTPDNYAARILPLIRGAKKTFRMQTQYITPPKSTPSPGTVTAQSDEVLEALIAAIAELIRENVDVKLIMSEFETQDKVELLKSRGIPQELIKIQENVHNKGIIVDSSIVAVGSHNWSGQGVTTNRDATVIIHSADAAKYWEQIFDHDWVNMAVVGVSTERR
jgi:hypothetical protein